MVSLWQVIAVACMATLAISLSIQTDCIAKKRHVADLHGTQTHITSWMGNENDTLILILGYGKGHPHFYDYIEVKYEGMEMKRIRENKATTNFRINFKQSLNFGWLDLTFIAKEKYIFNFTPTQFYDEFSGESDMKLKTFTVDGSNTTMNCILDTIYWKISNGITFIPLKLNSTNVFSLFSRSNFQPKFTAGNSSIELGFIDNVINDIQRYSSEYQRPLPRYEEHILKINCIAYQHCTYIIGIDATHKIKKTFKKSYTALSVDGKGNEFFIKLHRMEIRSASHHNATVVIHTTESIDGSIVSTIVLSLLLLIVIPTTAFIIIYKHTREHKTFQVDLFDEMKPIIERVSTTRNPSVLSSTVNLQTTTRLWDAAAHNDQDLVRHLLDTGKNPANREPGMPTSPLEEAHLLGHKEIVKMFANKLDSKQSAPTSDQIDFTFKELEKRIDKVFQASKYGIYDRGNGVNVLLQTHSLPGTIKDTNGWSLIHYMAAVKFSDERPAWELRDIRNFFNDHVYYINAIDHWGNTPLHILAQHQHLDNKSIMWDGSNMPVENAWVEMAKLLINYGCDPRIPNHQNVLPHDLATQSGSHNMAIYLKEKCEELGDIDHASAADKFDELLKAAKDNEVDKIIDLLKKNVPILPFLAQKNPLVEAIRNGHHEVVFLLICAGAHICNCSIDDHTPLEAAHNTIGLPALFPALMRKIYSDRLKAERNKITQEDDIHKCLTVGLINIQKSIREGGDKSKWHFTKQSSDEKNEEARKLLVAASGLGLSLTVQLLGMEDVELRPLPNEESPVDKAQAGDHFDTLYALCRDLKMAPYTTLKTSKILKRLGSVMLIAESNILKKCALEDKELHFISLDEYKVHTFLEKVFKPKESKPDWSVYDSDIFYILARYGLIYLLNMYITNNGKSILDKVVQEFSTSTMLHISVLYGQQHITEYLLYHGASPDKKTIGGFTIAHIAAILGNRESMNYIISYMNSKNISTKDKCYLGMTAEELFDTYEDLHTSSNYPFLNPEDAHNVKNEIGESDKTLEILRRKGKMMEIKNKVHLIRKIEELQRKNKEMNTSQAECIIKETKIFFEGMDNVNDGLFKGGLTECGPHCEDNVIFQNDIVRFALELDKYSAYGESKNVYLHEQTNGDLKILKQNTKCDLFQDNEFMRKFIGSVKDRIQIYKPSNENVHLFPPFMIPYACGVELCWAFNSGNRFNRVKSYINPVIKVDLPEMNGTNGLPEHILKFCNTTSTEIQVTNLKGEWTYRGFSLETEIFRNLNDNEKRVWQICRFIKLISKKYWWTPKSNIRKPVHRLDVDYVGVSFLQERALKVMFLKELAEKPENWGENDIFDRVISIYKRCVTIDKRENMHPIKNVKSFLFPKSYNNTIIPESICGVVEYLMELDS